MFTQAKLIMQSYLPQKLEKGMWFLGMQHGEIVVHELEYDVPNMEDYISINGAPVEPFIYIEGNPNVPDETFCIATPDMIGWFDAGEHSDELYDITLKEINNILENGGHCEIEVEEQHLDDAEAQEDYIQIVPFLLQDKVTIRYEDEDDEEHDWNDESWQFQGDEEYEDDQDNDNDDNWDFTPHYNF